MAMFLRQEMDDNISTQRDHAERISYDIWPEKLFIFGWACNQIGAT